MRLIALALTAVLMAAPASAQNVMKMASATINDVQHEWQKVFKGELESRVGDAVTVEIYPASQLGPIPQMAEGVAFGTVESFISPTSFLTPLDPRFQVFDVPGLFASPDELRAVIHDPQYRDHIETMFLDRGLRVIGAIYNSPVIVLTREPVETVPQMDGLKIRTFASPLQIKPMEAVGAIATPLPLSEVVPQLQSGGIDGMLAGMPILVAFKFYDIAACTSGVWDWNHASFTTFIETM
ncbi:MAG: TRAP transporter substrate-binding protein [Pseudomonadota bacterium]